MARFVPLREGHEAREELPAEAGAHRGKKDEPVHLIGRELGQLEGDRAPGAVAEEHTRARLPQQALSKALRVGPQRGEGRIAGDRGEAGQGDRREPQVQRDERLDPREAEGATPVAGRATRVSGIRREWRAGR